MKLKVIIIARKTNGNINKNVIGAACANFALIKSLINCAFLLITRINKN